MVPRRTTQNYRTLNELSEEEVAFIANAADTNLLMFQPNNDPLVVGLIERGFILSEQDADPDHTILSLSEKGRAVARLVLEERECPPT